MKKIIESRLNDEPIRCQEDLERLMRFGVVNILNISTVNPIKSNFLLTN